MRVFLFGSRVEGNARVDSDWDVLLVDEALVSKLIFPFPFRDPANTTVGQTTEQRMHHFYHEWQQWSLKVRERFGGDEGLRQLRLRAYNALLPSYPSINLDDVDLFLYTPPTYSPDTWAIRLMLDNRWPLKELGKAGAQYAVLEYAARGKPGNQEQVERHTGLP